MKGRSAIAKVQGVLGIDRVFCGGSHYCHCVGSDAVMSLCDVVMYGV